MHPSILNSKLSRCLATCFLQYSFFFAPGCFNEPSISNTFRFECRSDADCKESEQCIAELCQIPCNQFVEFDANGASILSDDCPEDRGYIGCFNGICSNLCTPGASTCPRKQECISPLGEINPKQRQFPMESNEPYLCGNLCSEGSTNCPGNLPCVQGLCTPIPKSIPRNKF